MIPIEGKGSYFHRDGSYAKHGEWKKGIFNGTIEFKEGRCIQRLHKKATIIRSYSYKNNRCFEGRFFIPSIRPRQPVEIAENPYSILRGTGSFLHSDGRWFHGTFKSKRFYGSIESKYGSIFIGIAKIKGFAKHSGVELFINGNYSLTEKTHSSPSLPRQKESYHQNPSLSIEYWARYKGQWIKEVLIRKTDQKRTIYGSPYLWTETDKMGTHEGCLHMKVWNLKSSICYGAIDRLIYHVVNQTWNIMHYGIEMRYSNSLMFFFGKNNASMKRIRIMKTNKLLFD